MIITPSVLLAAWMLAAAPHGEAKPGAVESNATQTLAFADHLLARGETWRALGEYERFLYQCGEGCEKAPYVQWKMAEAFRKAGDAPKAAVRLKELAAAYPDAPEAKDALRALGETLEAASDPAGASDAYRAYVERFAADPGAPDFALRSVRAGLRAHDSGRVKQGIPLAGGQGEGAERFEGLLREMEAARPRHRSPVLAGTLSALLPGAGHIYAGRARDGVASFVMNALFISAAAIAWDKEEYTLAAGLTGLEVFWYGGNVVGAVNSARRYNDRAVDAHWTDLERRFMPVPAVSMRFEF